MAIYAITEKGINLRLANKGLMDTVKCQLEEIGCINTTSGYAYSIIDSDDRLKIIVSVGKNSSREEYTFRFTHSYYNEECFAEFKDGDVIVKNAYSYLKQLDGKNYFSLTDLESAPESSEYYAKKSALYGKIMQDGNIYNPYIHRRFLPAQYMKIMYNINDFKNNITLKYIVHYVIDEAKRLEHLRRYDPITYRERCVFFNYDVISETLCNYLIYVKEDLKHRRLHVKILDYNNTYYSQHDKSIINNVLEEAKNAFAQCNSYYRFVTTFEKYNIRCIENLYSVNISNVFRKFMNAYLASGAYYTMKHLIMFDGYVFADGQTTELALKQLETNISCGVDSEKLQDKCKMLIENGIKVK